MRKMICMVLVLVTLISMLSGCAPQYKAVNKEYILFRDSCGREVELPRNITRVAPSGSIAQMILYTVAPDTLVGWSNNPGGVVLSYFPEKYRDMPVFGQFYGKNISLNYETLIAARPDVIIDMGDKKDGIEKDMDNIQKQTGIPTIFIEANMGAYSEAYRKLGGLLGAQDQAEAIAQYIEATMSDAAAARTKLPEDKKTRVMFGTGKTGLDCNAEGSIHATVIEAVGAINAIKVPELSNKGGGNTISMEQLLQFDPDVILFENGGPYAAVGSDELWSGLKAIKNDTYYEIPFGPHHFLASPPSVNQIIGMKWLGNLLYPELYDYDMVSEVKKFYELFWHYPLSDEEAQKLLASSTFKK